MHAYHTYRTSHESLLFIGLCLSSSFQNCINTEDIEIMTFMYSTKT